MAPEVSSEGIYDKQADMWALGILLREMVNPNIYSKGNVPPLSHEQIEAQEHLKTSA